MAGKKPSRTSKTARQAVRAGSGTAAGGLTVTGDIVRVIPLNEGRHCYLRTVDGRSVHVATAGPAFVELVRSQVTSAPAMAAKLRGELAGLAGRFPAHGWDATLARLEAASAFEPPAAG